MTAGPLNGCLVPYEILVEIFSRLSFGDVLSAGRVCRLWHDVSCDVLLPRREFCVDGSAAARAAPVLSQAVAPLSRLVLKEADVLADGVWEELWKSAGQLEDLRLLGCTVKEADLLQVLSLCPNLEELALVNCDSLFMTGSIFSGATACHLYLPCLRSLDLSHNRYLSDSILEKLLSLSPCLDTLRLAGCQIGFHPGIYKKFYPASAGTGSVSSSVLTFECVLSFIRNHAANMTSIDFSDTNVDDAALAQVAALADFQPRRLALTRCRGASDAGLASLLTSQKRLEQLDLSGTRAGAAVTCVLASLPSLRRLALRQCERLSAEVLAPLSGADLHELDLGGNERLPAEAAAAALPRQEPAHLRRLSLRAAKLAPETVCAAVARLPLLKQLDLSRCLTAVTDTTLQAICRHLRGLEVLRLSECGQLTDSGLTGLGLVTSPAADRPRPNKTFLHGDPGPQAAVQEPEAPPEAVQRNNPHAISLQSRHEREIWSDAERKTLVQRQIDFNEPGTGISLMDLQSLTELDLSQCARVSDVSVGHVLRLRGLRQLSLAHCAQLGDAGVARLGRQCPALEQLTLSHCAALGDAGLEGLLPHTPRLRHLDIAGCTALTDRTLRLIQQHCASLQYLNVSGCGRMSSGLAADVEELMPQLTTVLRGGLDGSAGVRGLPAPQPPPLPTLLRRR